MNEDIDVGWPAAEEKAKNFAQAKVLRDHHRKLVIPRS
jgi:hypothetical protein